MDYYFFLFSPFFILFCLLWYTKRKFKLYHKQSLENCEVHREWSDLTLGCLYLLCYMWDTARKIIRFVLWKCCSSEKESKPQLMHLFIVRWSEAGCIAKASSGCKRKENITNKNGHHKKTSDVHTSFIYILSSTRKGLVTFKRLNIFSWIIANNTLD